MSALLLAGCSPAPPAPTGCDAHADPTVAAYCWMTEGAAAATAEAAAALCANAAAYEADCRGQWVSAHLGAEVPTDALLDTCDASGDRGWDCALQVLDARPSPDALVQLAACAERAGPYAADCAVHAMSRWRQRRPDAAEVARVAAAGLAPNEAGPVVAAVVACQQVGDCGEHPALAPACREALETIARTPSICQEVAAPTGTAPAPR